MKTILFLGLGMLLLSPAFASAHPGNTDSSGCHTCRTNCPKWGLSTGEYHCHNAKTLPQPKEPVRSIKSDTGRGITVPAPEYKEGKSPTSKKQSVQKQKVTAPTTETKKRGFFDWLKTN